VTFIAAGSGRWTGRRLALASAVVCRSPETAWHACPQDLPSVELSYLDSDTRGGGGRADPGRGPALPEFSTILLRRKWPGPLLYDTQDPKNYDKAQSEDGFA